MGFVFNCGECCNVAASSGSDQSSGLKMTYNPAFAQPNRDPSCDSVTSLVSAGTGRSASPLCSYQRPHSITSK